MKTFHRFLHIRSIQACILCACLMGFFTGCGKVRRHPSFILISIDTTRVDRLGLYGNPRPVSPYLDAIGAEGLVFDQAVTVTENTLISHASLFTGLFPEAHGTTYKENGIPLSPSYKTIAEDFLSSGLYQTAGFTAHGGWLNKKFGMDQGFQAFSSGFRSADVVLKEAEDWYINQRDPEKPFFLFVHLFDPHSDADGRPYQVDQPFLGRWTSDPPERFKNWDKVSPNGSQFLIAVTEGKLALSEKEVKHIRDQYDEGLAYTDDRLGRFLAGYKNSDDLFVIITADHGEEFMEHNYMLHSSLYDPVVRIPLIILPPPSLNKRYKTPRRIQDQVRIVDLRPTILGMAGLPKPDTCQGENLVPWMTGRNKEFLSGPAPLYHHALRWKGWKLYFLKDSFHLYDLHTDPGEQIDLIDHPGQEKRIKEMKEILQKYAEEDREIRRIFRSQKGKKPVLTAEEQEKLRSLGYIK